MIINKYLYFLIFLIMLNTLIKLYDGFPYVKKNQDHDAFLRSLHKYYVHNIYYECFVLVFYILSYFGIFLILRINTLNKELTVITLSLGNFTVNSCINIVLLLLCIMFYINIINTLFYPNLVKLHYYFYQFKWYEYIIDKCHMQFNIVTEIFMSFSNKIGIYTWSEEDFNDYCTYKLKSAQITCSNSQELALIENQLLKEKDKWKYIQGNAILWYILFAMQELFWFFRPISRMLYSISYIILFIILLAEIHYGTLHYIYYALLCHFLIIWIKKIRLFLSMKDPLEKAITDYFYANGIPYKKIKSLLDNSSVITLSKNIGQETKTLLAYKDELITYILNDFVVYHIVYPNRKQNEKYINNDGKRKNILLLVFIGIVYYYINDFKYCLLLVNITIPIYALLIPMFMLLYFIHTKIFYETEEKSTEASIVFGENYKYKRLFSILAIIMVILMLYIMIKNKITVLPNETIFEIEGYIKIMEQYSIENKKKYLDDYLKIIMNALEITENHRSSIYEKAKETIILEDNLTLDMIRKKVDEVFSSWVENYKKDKIFGKNIFITIYEKIKHWVIK